MRTEAAARFGFPVVRDHEVRDGHRASFFGNIHHPKESVGGRREFLADFLIRDNHEIVVHDLVGQRQSRMSRARIGGAPVEYAQGFGFAHVRDIDDGKAAEPVTYVKPVVLSNRVMAAVIGTMPGGLLSAGHPLARHPPTADFLRLLRVLYIQDQRNVADVAFHVR
jgi:hypothetical protein